MEARLEAAKVGIVRSMYICTADENYITARWCASNSLTTDFLWLSFHSIEKYLKAALLLNGIIFNRSSHNICDLFEKFLLVGGEFTPDVLEKLPALNMDWRALETVVFVRHLARWGNPDGRYLVHGHLTDPEDVHRLDTLVFAIRRVCHNLDTQLLKDQPEACSIGRALRENPKLTLPHGLPLDRLINAKDTALRRAALNLNFAFAPANYPHAPDQRSSSDHMSPLDTYFFEQIASPQQEARDVAKELGQWALENIKLPKSLESEIRIALGREK